MKIVDFFVLVVNMSITASLTALCLFVLRKMFHKHITAGYCYLMWSLVFIRLVLPVSIPSVFSLFNLIPGEQPVSGNFAVTIEYIENTSGYTALKPDYFNVYLTFAAVWLVVFVILLAYQLILLAISKKKLSTAFRLDEMDLLVVCKEKLQLSRKIELYRSDVLDTPVVMGLFRPRIILPEFVELKDRQSLRCILVHELVHIRRFDHLTMMLATLVLSLHWFNPLVWLCFRQFQQDIETSCDERALSVLDESEKSVYANSLVEMCSKQKHYFDTLTLCFAERRSQLRTRVTGVLEYRPLSRIKRMILIALILGAGLLTTTNPIPSYKGFQPTGQEIDSRILQNFEEHTRLICEALSEGNADVLLDNTVFQDPYYAEQYAFFRNNPISVLSYRLFPQNEQLAYAYLRCTDGRKYVMSMEINEGELQVISLQPERSFASVMTVEDNEAIRFVRNLHRFGISGGERELSPASVAALCVDEEYRDRVKKGELLPQENLLPAEWVEIAAERYFGLKNFSYTFDEELYDAEKNCYIYDSEREAPINAEIVSFEEKGDNCIVVAELYSDPLRLIPKATISYQLMKK